MGQAIPIIMAAGGMLLQQAETQRVARKEDQTLAQSLLNTSRKQQQADTKVNEQLAKAEGSRSADERTQRMDQYLRTLQRGKAQADSGQAAGIGGEAFRADQAAAAEGAQQYATGTADLMARMDAPTLQRQNEAFDYGRLGTDLNLIAREAAGQRFIDDLRLRAIRRRPGVDLAAGALSAAGSMGAGGGGMAGTRSYTPVAQGGRAVYGVYNPSTMGVA